MTAQRSEMETGVAPLVSRPMIGGIRTRAIEIEGTGPVLLLLHGFSDQADTWSPVLAELGGLHRRAVAVDLPGYGAADPLRHGPTLPQLDAFLEAAVSHWTEHGRAPVVVGNSLGAVLALRAAQRAEVEMAGIVTISPPGFGHARLLEAVGRYHRLNPLLFRPVVPMSVYRRLVPPVFSYLAGGGAPILDGVAAVHAAQFRRPADITRLLATVPGLRTEVLASAAGHRAVDVPALVLWGRHDRLCKVAGAPLVGQLLPGGRVEILEDCGHCPQLQLPALVARHLVEFSDGLAPADRRKRRPRR